MTAQLLVAADGKAGAGESPETFTQIFSLRNGMAKLSGLINNLENSSLIKNQH